MKERPWQLNRLSTTQTREQMKRYEKKSITSALSLASAVLAFVGCGLFYAEQNYFTMIGSCVAPPLALFAGLAARRRYRKDRIALPLRIPTWIGLMLGSYITLLALVLIVFAKINENFPMPF
jgi:hypothetical protein